MKRSRASLVLIEQVVMILVFALAAALCLKAFVWADTESAALWERDKALRCAQNAAEVIKNCRGDMGAAVEIMGGSVNSGDWIIRYDENWQITEKEDPYCLVVSPRDDGLRYMASAEIMVYEYDTQLAALTAAWQEVAADEG